MQMALSKEWSYLLGKGSFAGEGVAETVGGALGHVSREAEVTTSWHPVQFGGDFYLIAGMRQLPMSLLWSFRTLEISLY